MGTRECHLVVSGKSDSTDRCHTVTVNVSGTRRPKSSFKQMENDYIRGQSKKSETWAVHLLIR